MSLSDYTKQIVVDSLQYGEFANPEGRNKSGIGFLFGHPIEHSVVPTFHEEISRLARKPLAFHRLDSTQMSDFTTAIESPDLVGASITMPHKIKCMQYMDSLTTEARVIGAINTVFVRLDRQTKQRRFIGTNTDCIGLSTAIHGIQPQILESVKRRPGLVIGAGGAARAAVYAMSELLGIQLIYVINRVQDESEAMIQHMKSVGLRARLVPVTGLRQVQHMETPAVIISCIPNTGTPTEAERLVQKMGFQCIQKQSREQEPCVLADMCYTPSVRTGFIEEAERMGIATLSGIDILLNQAVVQDALWLEVPLTQEMIKGPSQRIRDIIDDSS